jgi:hypothetical protein
MEIRKSVALQKMLSGGLNELRALSLCCLGRGTQNEIFRCDSEKDPRLRGSWFSRAGFVGCEMMTKTNTFCNALIFKGGTGAGFGVGGKMASAWRWISGPERQRANEKGA